MKVACALLGSLEALHMGILLASLALALFTLIAIESGGLIYAGLLGFSLDITWFILLTNKIRSVFQLYCVAIMLVLLPWLISFVMLFCSWPLFFI